MRRPDLRTVGLAAVILLAPGGFVLGATLAARAIRARARRGDEAGRQADDRGSGDAI